MREWRGVPVLLLVGILLGCGRPVPPQPPRKTSLVLPMHAFRIDNNGLRVVVVPDPKTSQIQVTMRYRVGAVDEPAGREGIAHLAEHLMFLQVVGPGRAELFDKLEASATWFNATTALETTTYVSRADPSRLADLLQIEGLRLGIRCSPRDLARDRAAGEVRVRAARERARACGPPPVRAARGRPRARRGDRRPRVRRARSVAGPLRQVQALNQLSANEAREIVQRHFTFQGAKVVTLLAAAAEDARKLTLGQMGAVLRGIDLARAAILMTGPPAAVTAGFTALGRTPRVVTK
jgi:zinc protease